MKLTAQFCKFNENGQFYEADKVYASHVELEWYSSVWIKLGKLLYSPAECFQLRAFLILGKFINISAKTHASTS